MKVNQGKKTFSRGLGLKPEPSNQTGRAGSRPRKVRPRPKAPPKNKKFLRKKGPTFHS